MLVYVNQMSMNMGELALIEVTDSKDVDGVKAILQARIDGMINGGAFIPSPPVSGPNAPGWCPTETTF